MAISVFTILQRIKKKKNYVLGKKRKTRKYQKMLITTSGKSKTVHATENDERRKRRIFQHHEPTTLPTRRKKKTKSHQTGDGPHHKHALDTHASYVSFRRPPFNNALRISSTSSDRGTLRSDRDATSRNFTTPSLSSDSPMTMASGIDRSSQYWSCASSFGLPLYDCSV